MFGRLFAPEDRTAGAGLVVRDGALGHGKALFRVEVRPFGAKLQGGLREASESAPLERIAKLEDLVHEADGGDVPITGDGAGEFVFNFVAAVVHLPHHHQDGVEHVEGLEPRHNDGKAVVAREDLVGSRTDDG